MSLDAHLDVAVAPDAVEFTLTVTNAGEESVDLDFRSGKEIDVAVFESDDDAAVSESEDDTAVPEDGTELWRWSDGRMFTQAIRTETLEPDESTARTVAWEDPEPGEYVAEATLEAAGVDVRERAEFSV